MEEKQAPILNIRDLELRDNFTASEMICFGITILFLVALSWLTNARSTLILGYVLIISTASMANLKIHQIVHPFIIDQFWRKVSYPLIIPICLLLAFYINGDYSNASTSMILEEGNSYTYSTPKPFIGNNIDVINNSISFLGLVSLFCFSTQLLLIPKSLYFINKLLHWGCTNALILTGIGLFYKFLNFQAPMFVKTESHYNFFAHFANDEQWGAFAILWMFTSYGLAIIELKKVEFKFSKSIARYFFMIALLLASTALVLKSDISAAFIAFSYAILCIKKIRFFKMLNQPIFKRLKNYTYFLLGTSISYGSYRTFKVNSELETIQALKATSFQMFQDSPIFGWGLDAFQKLMPYYSNSKLLDKYYETAPTGILSALIEFGSLGVLLMAGYLTYLLLRNFFLKRENSLSNNIFTGLMIVIILIFFENPFYNTAVLFSFWVLLFCALRWSKLIHNPSDQVDTKLKLVIKDHLRRVPFVLNPKKEVYK